MVDTIAPTLNAGDNRRATVLTVSYGRRDLDAFNAVLDEANQAGRVTPLIIGILELHAAVIPKLHTLDGLACLTSMVRELVDDPGAGIECTLGARLIIAHSDNDIDGFNEALSAAVEEELGTNLLVGILSVFSSCAPGLYSTLGLQVLQRSVLDWAAREEGVT